MRVSYAIAVLLLGAVPCGAQQLPPRYSDAHVHLNDAESWLRIMDEVGIVRTIALAGRDADNSALHAAGRRWPGRVLPFVSVSPEHRQFRAAWEADDERFVPLVDSLLSSGGYYGIGEISVSHFPATGFPEADFDPNGRFMRSLLQLASKHRVPVMIHSEVTRLREFEELLRDHRDVTVIWAHGGYTPLFLARRLLENHPNLIYELSARTWSRHPRSPDYTIFRDESAVWPEWLELIEHMPTRFVVGTDAAGRSESSDSANARRVQFFLSQLSTSALLQVAEKNLDRILGLTSDSADLKCRLCAWMDAQLKPEALSGAGGVMEDLRSEFGPIHYGLAAEAADSFLGCTSRSLEKSRTSRRWLPAEEFVLASG